MNPAPLGFRSAARALEAAERFLANHPGIHDSQAGRNALKFNLMCSTGLQVNVDESTPVEQWLLFTGEYPDQVIAMARSGDAVAQEALCAVAEQLTERGKPLPLSLQRFIIEGAFKAKKVRRRARHPAANLARDDALYFAVQLVEKFGFLPTRNDSSVPLPGDIDEHPSGCSIVAEALKHVQGGEALGERRIMEIWGCRHKAYERAKAQGHSLSSALTSVNLL